MLTRVTWVGPHRRNPIFTHMGGILFAKGVLKLLYVTYWFNKIKLEASDKSSLRFLNTETYEIGEVHCVNLEKCRFQSYGN